MKRILLLFSVVLLAGNLMGQSQRMMLMEEFTQASCPPCETTTPALNAVIAANAEKIVQIRYQTSWPGVDPMNADNPTEVRNRVDYYQVTGVPAVFADGTETGSPGSLPQATIDARYGTPAPIKIEVSHTIAADLSTVDCIVKITNEGTTAYDVATDKLRVALIEEDITWPTPPGSTSLTVFEAVMKTFFTTPAGIDVPAIAAGETYEMTFTGQAVPAVIYNFNKLAVVAFVQNDANKAVANAALSEAIELSGYPDLGVSNKSTAGGGLCEYGFTPICEVSNDGSLDVDAYTVNLVINGEIVDSKGADAPLAAGDKLTVTFDPITLPFGNSRISFNITNPLGDIATLNNNSQAITTGKAGNIEGAIQEDFEAEVLGTIPANTIVNRPFALRNFIAVNMAGLGGTDALGGHGESEFSVAINFWNWDPAAIGSATGSMTMVDRFHVYTADDKLSFDHAYTTWSGSNDRLRVQISKDCGVTYTPVFDKAGATLRTAPELNLNDQFFRPKASEWVTNEISLADFVGEDILVRFFVTSAWGDMLYIDNVNVESASDVNELSANEFIALTPNPANEMAVLDFQLEPASSVDVRVIDAVGKQVYSANVGKNVSGSFKHTLNTSDFHTGLYFVELNVDGKRIVKRLSVAH